TCGRASGFPTDSRRNLIGKLCGAQDRERRAQWVTVEIVDRRACSGRVSVDIEQTGLSESGGESCFRHGSMNSSARPAQATLGVDRSLMFTWQRSQQKASDPPDILGARDEPERAIGIRDVV